jgi:hypothetical protein
MVLRYATLVTLAGIALYALIKVGGHSGEWVLVDAGTTGSIDQQNFSYWLLAAIAGLTTFSLCRFMVFGIPSMIGVWYESRKEWLYAIGFGALACGVYYWM